MRRVKWLDQVLETIDQFGCASLGLIAWELSLPHEELEPALSVALSEQLVHPVGPSLETGEEMYALLIHSDPREKPSKPKAGSTNGAQPAAQTRTRQAVK